MQVFLQQYFPSAYIITEKWLLGTDLIKKRTGTQHTHTYILLSFVIIFRSLIIFTAVLLSWSKRTELWSARI